MTRGDDDQHLAGLPVTIERRLRRVERWVRAYKGFVTKKKLSGCGVLRG